MPVGRVVRDEVEPDLDPACPRRRDQLVEVGQSPEVGVHVEVVGDVVPQSTFGLGKVGLSQIASMPSQAR